MALMEWKDKYSVNVPTIDTQHQNLFATINELFDAMRSGTGAKLVPEILTRLVAYTRQHFSAEEALMKRTGYPSYPAHKAEHDKLTGEVVKLARDMEAGKVALSVHLLEFLRNWLQNHILSSDQKYSEHLRAAGVR
jgi:hemerythrin